MKQKNLLPKLRPNKIREILGRRKLENLTIIDKVESSLKKQRGYVFKMPSSFTPVISFMSGGLDTTVVTAILMEEFELQVYPVFFDRSLCHSKHDKKSVDFFANYFSKRYSNLFRPLFKISLRFPSRQLDNFLLPNSGHIFVNRSLNQRRGIPFLPSVFAYNAIHYAIFLKEKKGIKINTLIGAVLPSNIDWFSYESLTTHRAINLEICVALKDFSWQYTSLPLEKELGYNLGKVDLINWAVAHNLPLEKTRTCASSNKYHCGECVLCGVRKEAFKLAKVVDKTVYKTPESLINRARCEIKKLLR